MGVLMESIKHHTTHGANGAPIAREIGALYEVDEADVENLINLGFAKRAALAVTTGPAAAVVSPAAGSPTSPIPPVKSPPRKR